LASFATPSNGEEIDNPRFFREDELALAEANVISFLKDILLDEKRQM
jgi:hypothetical protein